MHIQADTLDDLLNKTFKELLALPFDNTASRSKEEGDFSEIYGIILELNNPLSRLSLSDTKGKTFSALGEFLWYFSGGEELDFIKYYIPQYEKESFDGKNIYGAYGPRIFNSSGKYNQLRNVINILKEKKASRRAVIQLFEARDIDTSVLENKISIPCTCTLQFLIRNSKLQMITFLRSNDAFKGLPHDIFAFTMLQEYLARILDLELGLYKHCVGSLHLYASSKTSAEKYIQEGYQSTKRFMPEMPKCDPDSALKMLLEFEEKVRNGKPYNVDSDFQNNYWKDLAYLLVIYKLAGENRITELTLIREKISNSIYLPFIDNKIVSSQKSN